MYNHCKILKKLNKKDLLTKSKIRLNIRRLYQMTDFVNRLKFKSFEIIILTKFSKSTDLIIIKENKKSAMITNNSEKIKKTDVKYYILKITKKIANFCLSHIYITIKINNLRRSRSISD